MLGKCREVPQQSYRTPPLSLRLVYWAEGGGWVRARVKCHCWLVVSIIWGLRGTEKLQKSPILYKQVCHNKADKGSLMKILLTLKTFPKAPSPNSPIMSHISSGFSSLRTCSYCFFFFSAPNLNILRKLKNDMMNPGSFNQRRKLTMEFSLNTLL